jgi:hypothetical protein
MYWHLAHNNYLFLNERRSLLEVIGRIDPAKAMDVTMATALRGFRPEALRCNLPENLSLDKVSDL